MWFYDDGSWEFAIAIQNDVGDTRFDNAGWYEQAGGALWFEAEDGETFQGTIDEDGVIADRLRLLPERADRHPAGLRPVAGHGSRGGGLVEWFASGAGGA